jgi:hypothetical protein
MRASIMAVHPMGRSWRRRSSQMMVAVMKKTMNAKDGDMIRIAPKEVRVAKILPAMAGMPTIQKTLTTGSEAAHQRSRKTWRQNAMI